MKKIFLIVSICIILLATGVVAQTLTEPREVEDLVNDIVEKKGIAKEKIEKIEKVNFSDLPEELNIENIDETNLAMYEVDIGEEKPFFVITVSEEIFKETVKEIANKMFLNFGFPGKLSDSRFLQTATGVDASIEQGYVMMREGSITGMSTNLDISKVGEGEVEIIIYKNKEQIGFRNTINGENLGVKSDYDTQSENTITFEPGDVISVYTQVNGNIAVDNVITMLEIQTIE
ncbi:hypothetical protein HOD29_04005 [archaeon]|mgnify:CR=1 FL=1|jgi:hypothetical protein|nr:hypothetical protein [archaeon]